MRIKEDPEPIFESNIKNNSIFLSHSSSLYQSFQISFFHSLSSAQAKPFQVRLQGGGPEEEQEKEDLVEVKESPPKKARRGVQYGIHKFFGSSEQQEEAKPVLVGAPIPYARKAKSQAQLDFEAAQEAMEQQLAEMEAEKSSEAFADMQKRMRLNHGKLFTGPKVTRQAPESRLELSANKKHLIAEDLKSHEAEYADRASFWRDMAKRHGMRTDHLREILRKAEEWKPLAAKPLLKKNSRNKLRKRRQGAGRKAPFEDLVRATKQWLSLERSSGHTISKQDVLSEFLARLRQSAKQLKVEAENTKLSALQSQQKLAESKLRGLQEVLSDQASQVDGCQVYNH